MSDEWSPARITEYRTIVDTLRRDSAKMAAGTLRASRQEGEGPLLDVTVETIALNEAQIKALEALISIELERGMEPVPHRRVDREGAATHFGTLPGERLRERMADAVERNPPAGHR